MNNYNVRQIENKVIDVSRQIAKEFSLPLSSILFIKSDALYGRCNPGGILEIKIEFHDGELVPEMEVWRTLAHEMAHLKHGNHGDDFWVYNRDLLNRISEILGKRIRPEIAFTRKHGVIY